MKVEKKSEKSEKREEEPRNSSKRIELVSSQVRQILGSEIWEESSQQVST